MRRFVLQLVGLVGVGLSIVGCGENSGPPPRVNDAGPPVDTGGGKGLPAMKAPGAGDTKAPGETTKPEKSK